jgi:hypothetical protein
LRGVADNIRKSFTLSIVFISTMRSSLHNTTFTEGDFMKCPHCGNDVVVEAGKVKKAPVKAAAKKPVAAAKKPAAAKSAAAKKPAAKKAVAAKKPAVKKPAAAKAPAKPLF